MTVVTPEFMSWGGVGSYVVQLAKNLPSDFEVHVISLDRKNAPEAGSHLDSRINVPWSGDREGHVRLQQSVPDQPMEKVRGAAFHLWFRPHTREPCPDVGYHAQGARIRYRIGNYCAYDDRFPTSGHKTVKAPITKFGKVGKDDVSIASLPLSGGTCVYEALQ